VRDRVAMPRLLEDFLTKREPGLAGARVTDYEPITGGYSRLMARFTLAHAEASKRYVLRGDPPSGESIIETDRAYEWELLSALARAGTGPWPVARWFDPDGSELGTRAIVLEWIDGTSVKEALTGSDEAEQAVMAEQLCVLAAAVHSTDLEVLPGTVEQPSDWDDYINGQIAMWAKAEREQPGSDPFMRYVGAWLEAHKPPPAPLCLVHGDFNISNMLVPPEGGLRIVDWEVARVGDPREDLGWFKLAAATVPPDLIGLDDVGFCARYRELTGLSEQVLNPATVTYFTVLGSAQVFIGLWRQSAAMAAGETESIQVAYTVNAQSFIHDVWMKATRALADTLGGPRPPEELA
jgi:aminoglycoside phosphotransferase (APT) family kinase protein